MSNANPQDNYYFITKGRLLKLLAFFCIAIFLGFLFHFPVNSILDTKIRSALKTNHSCPILFDTMKTSFFPPGYLLDNIKLSQACILPQGDRNKEITLKDTLISFAGISFSPLGPLISVQTTLFDSPFNMKTAIGFGTLRTKMTDTVLNLQNILMNLDIDANFQGDLHTNIIIETSANAIQDLKIAISSKNFIIGEQNLMGMMKIPSIPVKDLFIKVKSDEKSRVLKIEQMMIGADQSPLRIKVTGSVLPKMTNINLSTLNLKAEVFIDESLKSKFSILEMMLAKYNQENGFYQINIKGPLARPQLN